jgi:hypothetical protein
MAVRSGPLTRVSSDARSPQVRARSARYCSPRPAALVSGPAR